MEGITIRDIGPDDLGLLMRVEEGFFDHAIREDQARAFLSDPMNALMLAYDGEQAVGMISSTVLLHPDKAPAMFINELGVRESHRRQGIATALMEAMLSRARKRGCEGVWLATEADNVAALALYRGMAEVEEKGSFFGWDGAL